MGQEDIQAEGAGSAKAPEQKYDAHTREAAAEQTREGVGHRPCRASRATVRT